MYQHQGLKNLHKSKNSIPVQRPKKSTHLDESEKKKTKMVKKDKPKDQKLKKIAGALNDKNMEYKSESDEQLLIEEYLEKIGLYLRDMIDNPRTSDNWKIQPIIKKNLHVIRRYVVVIAR